MSDAVKKRRRKPLFRLLAGLATLGAAAGTAHAVPLATGAALADAQGVSFDVVLPLRDKAGLDALVTALHDPASPSYHRWLTPQQFAQRFGPDAAALHGAADALRAKGLTVEEGVRSLHVTGSAGSVGRTLSTSLALARLPSGRAHLAATSTPVLPKAVSEAGGVVLNFARSVREAHTFARRVQNGPLKIGPDNRTSTTGGYWYGDLKQAYQYPSYQSFVRTASGKVQRLDGTGTTIGILMSADVLDSDVDLVFNHEHFTANSGQAANPKLFKRVYVNGGAGTDSPAADEAALDVQEALTGAPGSHVILYDIPDLSDDNIMSGYMRIVDDNEADIVSSSFGGCELAYTAAYNQGTDYTYILDLEHELFEQGNAQGISFLASSGDEAGLECPTPNYVVNGAPGVFVPSVSVPAADPNVTAVGGTNVVTRHIAGSLDSTYVSENAFSDPEVPYDPYDLGANVSGGSWGAGGGVSSYFRKPLYQVATNTGSGKMRALPDIGMQVGGCPGGLSVLPCNGGNNPLNGSGNTDRSYVIVAIDGAFYGLIGTSVSSPELAGASALLVERYGRVGNLNNWIYLAGTAQTLSGGYLPALNLFHRNIPGYNGVVTNRTPGPNWNYTTGNGTPVVYKFVGSADTKPAGLPQSASNP
ncbi:S53 family peptidase [Rhizosaccharibacter radicis]|uniref:Protease pro-enzyme activation domain-containing protein n=1 Tax=Rhizosaccharibacter radicis TaxID=2782605 RepID=A0ABT1VYP8_9PROT|nr:protease pro-enzyme activation domain-containing protein [Acetobacteraceae bacterium KSS12]